MRKLFDIIKPMPYQRRLSILVALACLVALVTLVPPWLSRVLLNTATSQVSKAIADSSSAANAIVLRVVLLSTAYILASQIARLMQARTSLFQRSVTLDMATDLQVRLFDKLQRLSPDYFAERQAGETLQRVMGDAGPVMQLFKDIIWSVPYNCAIILYAFSLMFFRINWLLGVITFIAVPAQVYLNRAFAERLKPLRKDEERARQAVTSSLLETVANIDEVRSQNGIAYHSFHFRKQLTDWDNIQLKHARIEERASLLAGFVSNISVVLLLLAGILLLIGGENWITRLYRLMPSTVQSGPILQIGDLLFVLQMYPLLSGAVDALLALPRAWASGRIHIDSTHDFLSRPAYVNEGGKPAQLGEKEIKLEKASVKTASGEVIVLDVDAQAPPRSRIAFVGPAGCGKSTTIRLLNRSRIPTQGRVLIGESPIEDYDFNSLTREVGCVSQNAQVFSGTVLLNLVYGLLRPSSNPVLVDGLPVDPTSLFGTGNAEEVERDAVRMAAAVGLDQELFSWSMQMAIGEGSQLPESLVQALEMIRKDMRSGAVADKVAVSFFDDPAYQECQSVAENLFRGIVDLDLLEEEKALRQEFMAFLRKCELVAPLMRLAVRISQSDKGRLLQAKSPESGLLKALGISKRAAKAISQLGGLRWEGQECLSLIESLPLNAKADVVFAALRHVESQQPLIDQPLSRSVVSARDAAGTGCPQVRSRCVRPFDQRSVIRGLTLRENLLFGRPDPRTYGAKSDVERLLGEVLKRMGLFDTVVRLGLRYDVGTQGARLSGGQRQKICLARNLLKNPRVLILDEATSALDNRSQAKVGALLASEFGECLTVSVAHRLESIRHYDKIYVMEQGRVVESGTYDELMENRGLFSELVSLQLTTPAN